MLRLQDGLRLNLVVQSAGRPFERDRTFARAAAVLWCGHMARPRSGHQVMEIQAFIGLRERSEFNTDPTALDRVPVLAFPVNDPAKDR
jgi:hypothetical protein